MEVIKMRSKIFMSMLMIALVAALVGGATFALFTDTTTNADNTFAAGTVDISAGAQTYTVAINNMAPGDSIPGSFVVKNEGSLKLWYQVTSSAAGALFQGATPAVVVPPATEWAALDPGQSATISYNVSLPLAAGNEYQGVSGTLGFIVNAEQFDNNPTPAL